MFREDSDAEAAFRAELRDWIEANLPKDLRNLTLRPAPDRLRAWHGMLHEKGWAAPHWPKEYGGMGATLNEQIIFVEEFARAGAPTLMALGLNFLAPAMMVYGTEEQKAEHLPKILSGERMFAQGYSEPGSGSDLASLSTRAELQGDHYVVNGQKIWNTWSHYADWMFALVRTDPNATPKHAGISVLMFDIHSPGITVQSIDTIAGDDELATVFFDDVKVPKENLLGPLHGGWKVANHVLSFERFTTGNPINTIIAMERLKEVAAATGADRAAGFRRKLAALELELMAQQAIFAQAVAIHNSGRILGPDSSMMKIVGTETLQAITDLMVEATGGAGPGVAPIEAPPGPQDVTPLYLLSRRATIYGGSSEIQRNVLAKRVLNLPTK